MKYKKELVAAGLLIDKRMGQGNPNRIYVLRPDESPVSEDVVDVYPQKSEKSTSSDKSKISTSKRRKDLPAKVEETNGIYTDFKDTDFKDTDKQEEEETSSARVRFARFSSVVDEMIKRNGSLSYKDEEYLEECLAAGWDTNTAYRIYMRIRDALDVCHFDAIHMTFAAFQKAMTGDGILHPTAWFAETLESMDTNARLGRK
jgi:hypothetical protein